MSPNDKYHNLSEDTLQKYAIYLFQEIITNHGVLLNHSLYIHGNHGKIPDFGMSLSFATLNDVYIMK
jgi:hypothetical protein